MKKLPLGQPPISAYLFHAYPLSILAQEDRYLPWFYSTYIQLFSFPDEELKFYTHPCCTHHQIRHLYVQTCPLLEARSIDRKTLAPTPTGLGAWIRDAIEHKCYVQVDVDFFYLPIDFKNKCNVAICNTSSHLVEASFVRRLINISAKKVNLLWPALLVFL